MASRRTEERRLRTWQERLDYLEREYRRMPEAIETARKAVEYWQAKLHPPASEPETQAEPPKQLTREPSSAWAGEFIPGKSGR